MEYIKNNTLTKEKNMWINQVNDWYRENKRDLLWRKKENQNFYSIWISEIMLQQTGVKTVENYFIKFKRKWPTLELFLNAKIDDILLLWQGLGYYQRAKNIYKTLQILKRKKIRPTYEELLKLPGIGDYTASSISAILNDENNAVVDGNITRIISRSFGISSDIKDFKKKIYLKAKELTPLKGNGDYCQALMDIGSTICKPVNPKCEICPIFNLCSFQKYNTKNIKKNTKKKIFKEALVFFIEHKNEIFIQKSDSNFLYGLMKFPTSNFEVVGDKGKKKLNYNVIENYGLNKYELIKFGHIKHKFTNFDLKLEIIKVNLDYKFYHPTGLWINENDFFNYPFSKLMVKVFDKVLN